MRAIEDKKTTCIFQTILFVAVMFCFAVTVAADEQQSALPGASFSDPAVIIEMPGEWMNQPIVYENWAKGADIAVLLDQHSMQILHPSIEKYAITNNINIKVKEGTCGVSSKLLYKKSVDIAGFCCPPSEGDRLPQLRFNTYGLTGLTVLVHPENPIDSITFEQAQRIFQGRIRNWSELKTADGRPGPDMKTKVFARLHCKLRPGHWCSLLENEDLFSPAMYELGSISDVIEKSVSSTQAIAGFESPFMAYQRFPQEINPKFLTIDGRSPVNSGDIVSGKYPMYFVFNLTTWEGKGIENPYAKKLVAYLIEEIENIGNKHYIVPVAEFRKAGWEFRENELIGEAK